MPEIYYELPGISEVPLIEDLPPTIRSTPLKTLSAAGIASGLLAYASPPPPHDWQKWVNKAFRHWLWHELQRKRRRHFPLIWADTWHLPKR